MWRGFRAASTRCPHCRSDGAPWTTSARRGCRLVRRQASAARTHATRLARSSVAGPPREQTRGKATRLDVPRFGAMRLATPDPRAQGIGAGLPPTRARDLLNLDARSKTATSIQRLSPPLARMTPPTSTPTACSQAQTVQRTGEAVCSQQPSRYSSASTRHSDASYRRPVRRGHAASGPPPLQLPDDGRWNAPAPCPPADRGRRPRRPHRGSGGCASDVGCVHRDDASVDVGASSPSLVVDRHEPEVKAGAEGSRCRDRIDRDSARAASPSRRSRSAPITPHGSRSSRGRAVPVAKRFERGRRDVRLHPRPRLSEPNAPAAVTGGDNRLPRAVRALGSIAPRNVTKGEFAPVGSPHLDVGRTSGPHLGAPPTLCRSSRTLCHARSRYALRRPSTQPDATTDSGYTADFGSPYERREC